MKKEILFEKLFEKQLENNYGDFSKCEKYWETISSEKTEEILTKAFDALSKMGFSFEADITGVMNKMTEDGTVFHLPFLFLRAKTNKRKCPRCGASMMHDVNALSRYDNKTEICSACGVNEAMEDFTKTISD